jgi:nonsense-mediated mRNA decay protein 3
MAPDLARSAVHFHPDVKKPSIEVIVEDLTINRSRAYLKIHGTMYRKPVNGDCMVEIIWQKEQCDRCNRISGSYYEGVVQVRADGRIPSAYEVQQAASIAQQIEDTVQAGGERLSFISDMNEIHDGLDIIVGSQHIGTMISQGIIAQLGGRFSTHPKLVGEKNGRQLFRITYSVRLPRFQKHDVVVVRGRYFEIGQVESRHLRVLDLMDGSMKSLREGDIERIIGNSRNAEHAIVVFAEDNTLGILDPESHKTREFRNPKWMDAKAGQHVSMMRDGDQVVIIG